jgi:hypothetical protein
MRIRMATGARTVDVTVNTSPIETEDAALQTLNLFLTQQFGWSQAP